jgi:ribosomal protein S18 acetylase RimI-like enzyme
MVAGMVSRAVELDLDTLRFLEFHETRVHAIPFRRVQDLGDAILLHDPSDAEPFWNRVAGVVWPADTAAFDRRLDEVVTLFATIDRLPHVWPRPIRNEPPDLVDRLLAAGFEDAGAGLVMVLDDDAAGPGAGSAPDRLAAGNGAVTLESLHAMPTPERERAAAAVSLVLAESFEVDPDRRSTIEAETAAWLAHPALHVTLARVDGEPAAVAKRATFDGATYLSSIGTRPAFRGRGLGSLVTAAAARDGVAEGSRWTYLGVFSTNDGARRMYERLGFVVIGGEAPDLILR